MIAFLVYGDPKGQPRPRAFVRKTAAGFKARVFDSGTAENWKSLVAEAAKPYLPPAPIGGPVRLEICFLLPRPQRLNGKKHPPQAIPHTAKPDTDNLVKAIMDCLSQLRFWEDDRQVYRITASKHYVEKGGRPGAIVSVIDHSIAPELRCDITGHRLGTGSV